MHVASIFFLQNIVDSKNSYTYIVIPLHFPQSYTPHTLVGFDLHIFCGMHDAKSYLLRSNGKQEAFTRRESYELCTM